MKYIAVVVSLFFLIMPLVAQDYVLADTESMPQEPPAEMYDAKPESDSGVVRERIDSDGEIAEGNHQVTVPKAKRPKKGDSEKIAELDNEDTEEDKEKRRDTIRFGLESEIIELIDELTKKEDARYADDIYDLFQDTKNITLKERILGYYAKLEDPCVEDYAIEILDDPYDEKQSTVNACFDYAKAVKTKEAIAPVLNLLESDNEDYFNQCLDTLGKVGGSGEAVYLTEYLDREDLSVSQKQALVRVLGELKATETYDKLVEIAQDTEENTFMRMYSAEAIGAMENPDAIPVLLDLYEDTDPNMRIYVIKGLAHFPQDADARKTIIQGVRDSYYKVRLEAINVVKEQSFSAAVPYLIHRAKNDPEKVVKEASYPVIAKLDTKEGNEYLVSQITDKKVSDNTKAKIAAALLAENHAGTNEILALAKEVVADDAKNNPRKALRYALGKEFAKYARSEFADICADYLASKDVATQGTGLDIYNKGKYASVESAVRRLADQYDPTAKSKNPNAQKAAKILGITEAEAEKRAEAKKAEKDAK